MKCHFHASNRKGDHFHSQVPGTIHCHSTVGVIVQHLFDFMASLVVHLGKKFMANELALLPWKQSNT